MRRCAGAPVRRWLSRQYLGFGFRQLDQHSRAFDLGGTGVPPPDVGAAGQDDRDTRAPEAVPECVGRGYNRGFLACSQERNQHCGAVLGLLKVPWMQEDAADLNLARNPIPAQTKQTGRDPNAR